MYHHGDYNLIKLAHFDETKTLAHDSQIAELKKTSLNHGWPSQRHAPGSNHPMIVLRQGRH